MADWTKRRRLEGAITGKKVDRLPVALWRHWPGDDQDASALATAHLKWQQDYDWDLVKVSPASSYPIKDWGAKDEWVGSIEGTRNYTRRVIQAPEDWENLTPLDPRKGMLSIQIEVLQLVGNDLGEEVPYLATIFSPLAQAKNLAGEGTMLSHMRSHPDTFHKGLKAITESTTSYIEAARETGISGIYYAVQHSRYELMSREEYAAFGRPYDLSILQSASDLWLNILHIHSTGIMFDMVADYPVALVNWHDRDCGISLKEGLSQIGGAASGGVSQWSIHRESPDQALAEARDAMAQTGGRRLVLGTGCVIMVTTPTRNIRTLREFAEHTQRR
jgi:uroporphyrinogen decarboxylase